MTDPLHEYHPIDRRTRAGVNVGTRERVASAAVGGALVTLGLRPRSAVATLLLELVGGGLLYRATSGHCHVYDALDMNTAERERRKSGTEADIALESQEIPAAEPDPLAPDPLHSAASGRR